MFYQGSLQEGISTAVGQQKLVLCFVTDECEESQTWENEFLLDQSLEDLIAHQAIALRLLAGSEEAGYLAQIFPLPKTPTVVIIKNGDLKEYITPGVSKDDFIRRIQSAFNATPAAAAASSSTQSHGQNSSSANARQAGSEPATVGSQQAAQQSDNVRRILAERARVKAQRDEDERKAQEEQARAKEEAEAADAARLRKQAELVRKKKQHDNEERQRILKRIQDDRAERRQIAAEKEKQRIEAHKSESEEPQVRRPSTTKISDTTSLQVRLFDGSTIRSRFDTTSTLKEVRKWVDEDRNDGSLPYTFKQVLTPLPNKNIDSTEESKDLGELGLAPSSTLLLIPVSEYSSAYEGDSGNVFSRFLRLILGFFTWVLSLIGLGGESGGDVLLGEDDAEESEATSSEERANGRGHRRLSDRRRDHQLYNGNSLNFEPRPDEDEK